MEDCFRSLFLTDCSININFFEEEICGWLDLTEVAIIVLQMIVTRIGSYLNNEKIHDIDNVGTQSFSDVTTFNQNNADRPLLQPNTTENSQPPLADTIIYEETENENSCATVFTERLMYYPWSVTANCKSFLLYSVSWTGFFHEDIKRSLRRNKHVVQKAIQNIDKEDNLTQKTLQKHEEVIHGDSRIQIPGAEECSEDKESSIPTLQKNKESPIPTVQNNKESPVPTMQNKKESPIPTVQNNKEYPHPTVQSNKEYPLPTVQNNREYPHPTVQSNKEYPVPTVQNNREYPIPTVQNNREYPIPAVPKNKESPIPTIQKKVYQEIMPLLDLRFTCGETPLNDNFKTVHLYISLQTKLSKDLTVQESFSENKSIKIHVQKDIAFKPRLDHKCTVPEPFHFGNNKSKADLKTKNEKSFKPKLCHEYTVPEPFFKGENRQVHLPVGIPVNLKLDHKHTIPEPFNFSHNNTTENVVKDVLFQPKLKHEYTVPEPFEFVERDKYFLARKEEKIQQIRREQKKMEEKAIERRSAPHFAKPFQPKLVHRCTTPKPFRFTEQNNNRLKAVKQLKENKKSKSV